MNDYSSVTVMEKDGWRYVEFVVYTPRFNTKNGDREVYREDRMVMIAEQYFRRVTSEQADC